MDASGLSLGQGFELTMASTSVRSSVWISRSPRCPHCKEELEPVMSGIPFACPYCDEVLIMLPDGTMEHLPAMPFPPGIGGLPSEG